MMNGMWGTERRVCSNWTSLPGLQWVVACVPHLRGELSTYQEIRKREAGPGCPRLAGRWGRGRCGGQRCAGCHGDAAALAPSFRSA